MDSNLFDILLSKMQDVEKSPILTGSNKKIVVMTLLEGIVFKTHSEEETKIIMNILSESIDWICKLANSNLSSIKALRSRFKKCCIL